MSKKRSVVVLATYYCIFPSSEGKIRESPRARDRCFSRCIPIRVRLLCLLHIRAPQPLLKPKPLLSFTSFFFCLSIKMDNQPNNPPSPLPSPPSPPKPDLPSPRRSPTLLGDLAGGVPAADANNAPPADENLLPKKPNGFQPHPLPSVAFPPPRTDTAAAPAARCCSRFHWQQQQL